MSGGESAAALLPETEADGPMVFDEPAPSPSGLRNLALTFVRDFARYAGIVGLAFGVWAGVAIVLEWVGLATMVPLLGMVTRSAGTRSSLETLADEIFAQLNIDAPVTRVLILLLIFSALVSLRAFALSNRDVKSVDLQIGFIEMLRLRLVQRIAFAPWDRVLRLRHARIAHLLSGDVQNVGIAVQDLVRIANLATALMSQAVLLLLLAPGLALCVLAVMLASPVLFLPIVRNAHKLGAAEGTASLSLLDTTAHFLGGLKLAISQNLQPGFIREFHDTVDSLRLKQVAFRRRQSTTRLLQVAFTALAGALFIFIGFGLLHTAAPVLILCLLIASRMAGPVVQLQETTEKFFRLLPAYGAVISMEAAFGEPPASRTVHAPVLDFEGAIVLQGVAYQHAEDRSAGVRDLNLMIAPGEFLGVTGPSGAGKTTFADLLVGLLPPQTGRITVGRTALTSETLGPWRDKVAYVSQDTFLFHDTVRRNLTWVSPAVEEDELWRALELADAGDLVRAMPQQLDTMVGERGALISGGERQRLALARAMLRRPRLLVLDEATSAIDIAGERLILERLRDLKPRPTIILIAHRAESLSVCDRVLQFEAGMLSA